MPDAPETAPIAPTPSEVRGHPKQTTIDGLERILEMLEKRQATTALEGLRLDSTNGKSKR